MSRYFQSDASAEKTPSLESFVIVFSNHLGEEHSVLECNGV